MNLAHILTIMQAFPWVAIGTPKASAVPGPGQVDSCFPVELWSTG
jgi:hypothetical protein